MKKINIFLLIVYITIISLTFCGLCGLNPPEGPDYCGNYISQNSTHRCCYCKNNNNNKYYCLLVVNGEEIDGYDCDCRNVHENDDVPGAPCYNHTSTRKKIVEITREYCHGNSLDKRHPCCFYDDGKDQTCFSVGKITSLSLYTYNEFLDCFSKYEKINLLMIFFIFFCLI